VKAWNKWREGRPDVIPDLSGAQLQGRELARINLQSANLRGATFRRAYVSQADFRNANLFETRFVQAYLREVDFSHARMEKANLTSAGLYRSTLVSADLREATLAYASLVEANCENAIFDKCDVYGISAWNLKLTGASQIDLRISANHKPLITVDDLQLAQFLHLLLNNQNLRQIIDTVTSKAALILGRFTAERKATLDAIREHLRKVDYLPVLFDFEQPSSRSTMETVSTLAGMARFIIADLTDAKSVLQELREIVPNRPSVPIQPIILATQAEPGMFDFFRLFPWVLKTHYYATPAELLGSIGECVIGLAERRVAEQSMRRN
jgi:hypothetical protein